MRFLRRHLALPDDHGTWVFLLSPLVIGLVAGGRWSAPAAYLVVASVSGFLMRQPVTLAVKALAGRRSRRELPAALAWAVLYATIAGLNLLGLVLRGFGYVLILALPGIVVYAWYLVLVARRRERRQRALEVLAAGVLALAAPAGLWVGLGRPAPIGWLLWLLVWAQSAASIVHVYLRLEQRGLAAPSALAERLGMAAPDLAFATCNLILAAGLGLARVVPLGITAAYLPQLAEAVSAALRPAAGSRPTAIGLRQLAASALFTLLFLLA